MGYGELASPRTATHGVGCSYVPFDSEARSPGCEGFSDALRAWLPHATCLGGEEVGFVLRNVSYSCEQGLRCEDPLVERAVSYLTQFAPLCAAAAETSPLWIESVAHRGCWPSTPYRSWAFGNLWKDYAVEFYMARIGESIEDRRLASDWEDFISDVGMEAEFHPVIEGAGIPATQAEVMSAWLVMKNDVPEELIYPLEAGPECDMANLSECREVRLHAHLHDLRELVSELQRWSGRSEVDEVLRQARERRERVEEVLRP